jgi:hypothetical protein
MTASKPSSRLGETHILTQLASAIQHTDLQSIYNIITCQTTSCQAAFYAKGRGGPTNCIVWSTAFVARQHAEKQEPQGTKEKVGGHGAPKLLIYSTSWQLGAGLATARLVPPGPRREHRFGAKPCVFSIGFDIDF